MMFPISINSYNVEAQRAAFDAFNSFTADDAFLNSAGTLQAFSLNCDTDRKRLQFSSKDIPRKLSKLCPPLTRRSLIVRITS